LKVYSPRRIESYLLDGAAGKIECLLEEPESGEPREACLVCHPHPRYGGTMHNKVVYRMARALRRSGSVVLRFNFRGVGRSQGAHDQGAGELEDARLLVEWLRSRYPELPYSVAGFSFGSRIALRLGCSVEGVRRIIAVGFPTKSANVDYLKSCLTLKIFVQSTHDEHGPRQELEAIYREVADPKQIHWVPATDHFFRDGLDTLEETILQLQVG
jgi:alpha/beta superfamily hydrolase